MTALVAFSALLLTRAPKDRLPPMPGDTLAPFAMPSLSEQPVSWKPGRVTAITVIAYWCDTWKEQFLRLSETSRRTAGLPVDCLSVAVDGRWTELSKNGAWGDQLADRSGLWSQSIHIDRVPYTLVVDRAGNITFARYGVVRSDELAGAIRSAVIGVSPTWACLNFIGLPDDDLLGTLRHLGVPATFTCSRASIEKHAACCALAAVEGHSIVVSDLGIPDGLAADDSHLNATDLTRRVLMKLHAGSVVTLHADYSETRVALPQIVSRARKQSIEFRVGRVAK